MPPRRSFRIGQFGAPRQTTWEILGRVPAFDRCISTRKARFPASGHALLCERCDAVKLAVISAKPNKLLWELLGIKT